MTDAPEESSHRITQEEIDYLLDCFPFEPARSRKAPGMVSRSDASPSRFLPRLLRQGRQGLGLSLSEAAALWRALLDRLFLDEMGLGPGQWVILWLTAAQGGEARGGELAEALEASPEELAVELAVLESRGYVKLLDRGQGASAVCIRDYQAVQRLLAMSRDLRDRALRGLGEEEIAALHQALLKVIDNLREAGGPGGGTPT